MKRLLCRLGRHEWQDWNLYPNVLCLCAWRWCERCGKYEHDIDEHCGRY